ncbi:hypothetical protein T484DRAFT_1803499 [Baffinella frigidus]|nr:hypothetical protein T484DRAFT_1803499 [Cryptophyta sp. CCMP2293]
MPRISALTLGALLLCILPPSHTFTGPSIFPLQTRTSRTTSALRMVEDATAGSAGRLVSGRRAAVQALAGAVVAGAAGATASSGWWYDETELGIV